MKKIKQCISKLYQRVLKLYRFYKKSIIFFLLVLFSLYLFKFFTITNYGCLNGNDSILYLPLDKINLDLNKTGLNKKQRKLLFFSCFVGVVSLGIFLKYGFNTKLKIQEKDHVIENEEKLPIGTLPYIPSEWTWEELIVSCNITMTLLLGAFSPCGVKFVRRVNTINEWKNLGKAKVLYIPEPLTQWKVVGYSRLP